MPRLYTLDPSLCNILRVITPSGSIVKPRTISYKDSDRLLESKMIGTASLALSEIFLSYQQASISVIFKAARLRTSPQLYYVDPKARFSIPREALRENVKRSCFKSLDLAIMNFFLEAHCHVHCNFILENVHLWLEILINDFKPLYERDSELFSAHKIDYFFLKNLFTLFYESAYCLCEKPDERTKNALYKYLTHLEEIFLNLFESQKRLEESSKEGFLSEGSLKKESQLKLIQEALPHLLKILVGFHSSLICADLKTDSRSTITERAYAPSYTAERVFRQAIQTTHLFNNLFFKPLENRMPSANLPEEADKVISYLNAQKILIHSVKHQVDELICAASELSLPFDNTSKKSLELAFLNFFTGNRRKEWDCLADPLASAYFHLLNPRKIHINPKWIGQFAFLDRPPYPMNYVKGSKLNEDLLEILRNYSKGHQKLPKQVKSYLKILNDAISSIAELIKRPSLERLWTTRPKAGDSVIIIGNSVASDFLEEFSDICEQVNESLNNDREILSLYLSSIERKDLNKIEKALDEICQAFLKESITLVINPNFIGKLLYYIKTHGLYFEGEGAVIIDINHDNADSIIRPLIDLGICPHSFLELFDWRLEKEDSSKKTEPELAQIVSPEVGYEFSLAPDGSSSGVGSSTVSLAEASLHTASAESLPYFHSTFIAETEAKPSAARKPHDPSPMSFMEDSAFVFEGSHLKTTAKSSSTTESESPEKKLSRFEIRYPVSYRTHSSVDFKAEGSGGTSASRAHSLVPKTLLKDTPAKSSSFPLLEEAKEEIEEDLEILIEQLNGLIRHGVKTREIFSWVKSHGFKYDRHHGDHAIYYYKNKLVTIPDKKHLKRGLLQGLREAIINAFSHTATTSPKKS